MGAILLMGIGTPDTRKTHIVRIFFVDRDGNRIDGKWIDVERIDVAKGATQVAPDMQWQGYQRILRWRDDPNDESYQPEGTPSRKHEVIKVCGPDDNFDDPDEFANLRVIRGMRNAQETGTAANGGSAQERFLAQDVLAGDNERVVEVRKVVHYDTNIDDLVQAALDADPTLLEYVVPTEEYERDTSTKDTDQYVEQEFITVLRSRGNTNDVNALGRETRLLNEYLIDMHEPPDSGRPAYKLDPYQNIVNCSIGGAKETWLAATSRSVQTGPTVADVYGNAPWSAHSGQGGTYADVLQGASGKGFTVLCHGGVAYGKVTFPDGARRGVFMTADINFDISAGSGVVKIGIPDGDAIQWSTVFTVPPYESFGPIITALSYAGERFFVTYETEGVTHVASTADGYSWVSAVTCRFGRNVAYLDDVGYAMVGSTQVETGGEDSISSDSLTWATSPDGVSWATGFNPSPTGGPGGAYLLPTNIAAGNGVFVASSSAKYEFENNTGGVGDGTFYILPKSAVAVSPDGSSWSVVELPGGSVAGGPDMFETGDHGSWGVCVAFINDKDGETGSPSIDSSFGVGGNGRDGYFVASDYRGYADHITGSHLYVSVTGSGWGTLESSTGDVVNGSAATIYSSLTAISKNAEKTKQVFVTA